MGATQSSNTTQVDSSRLSLPCNITYQFGQTQIDQRDTNWTVSAPVVVKAGDTVSFSGLTTRFLLPRAYPTFTAETGDLDGSANVSYSFRVGNAASPDWLNITYYNAPFHVTRVTDSYLQVPKSGEAPLTIGSAIAGDGSHDLHLRLVNVDIAAYTPVYIGQQYFSYGVENGAPEYILSSVAVE